jgi:hypothetical protein
MKCRGCVLVSVVDVAWRIAQGDPPAQRDAPKWLGGLELRLEELSSADQ